MLAIFLSSFVIGLSGALVPGPLLTLVVAESARRGAIAGPIVVTGHALIELILVVFLYVGFAAILADPRVFAAVATVGGAFLLWMAFSMMKIRHLPSEQTTSKNSGNLIFSGLVISISNPYFIFWWVTIGAGYVVMAQRFGVVGVIFFYLGHIFSDFAWYTVVSSGVAVGRRFVTDQGYRGLMIGCAFFLVVFACCFFYAGLKPYC